MPPASAKPQRPSPVAAPRDPAAQRARHEAILRELGRRLRTARLLRGLTLAELAERAGVSRHQIRNYEGAQDMLSAGRLYAMASALGFPVAELLHGMEREPEPAGWMESLAPDAAGERMDDEGLALMLHFNRIRDPELRRHLLAAVRRMSGD